MVGLRTCWCLVLPELLDVRGSLLYRTLESPISAVVRSEELQES